MASDRKDRAKLEFSADGPDIPQLKKKEEEEKKGGGLVAGQGTGGGGGNFLYRWLGIGSPSGGALSGAGQLAAGAGRSVGLLPGLASFLTSNAGLALLTAALSAMAVYGLYAFGLSPSDGARGKASVFPAKESSSAAASGAGAQAQDPGSLSYFSNANKGAFGEGKPGEAKDGAGPAEQPKADGSEVKPPAMPDVSKLVSEASGGGKQKMVSAPSFGSSRALGGGNGLAGGAGMAGGLTKPFAGKAPSALSQFSRAKTDKGAAQRAMTPIRNSKALDQLRFTSRSSQQARTAGGAEGQSGKATDAFEGGLGNTGNGTPPGLGFGTANGAGTPNANPESGPIASSSLGQQAPPVGQSGDQSPYTGALMMGVALLGTASTIILIEGIVAQLAKIIIPLEPIAQMLAAMAAALAAAAAAIGVMIMTQHGQMQQGMVLTVGGGITSAAAIAALVAPPEAAPIILVLGGIAGLVASMLSMITGMMGNKVH